MSNTLSFSPVLKSLYQATRRSRRRWQALRSRQDRASGFARLEVLEDRALLASALGTPVFPASNELPVNESHVGTELLTFSTMNPETDSDPAAQALAREFAGDAGLIVDSEGRAVVRITTSDAEKLAPLLQEHGMEIIASLPNHNLIEGYASAATLRTLATLPNPELLGIVPVYQPQTGKGSVTSQADYVHEADRVRAARPNGYDGQGIKVGVMSDSYDTMNGAAGDIASGDLPPNVNVVRDAMSGIDEGRAMLQLVHDVAPMAELAFADVLRGEADFAAQIHKLARPNGPFGADILTDDIFYFNEPMFQDGLITQAIDEVVDQYDVAYFALAGNLENQAYHSGNFNASFDTFYSGFYHDFDPGFGTDTRQRITIPGGTSITVSIQWDDPFFTTSGVDTDLNLFLLDANSNNVVASAANNNLSNQQPVELLRFTNQSGSPRSFDFLIQLAAGPQPGLIKYVNYGRNNGPGIVFHEYATNSPTVIPHSSAVRGLGVGAVDYFERDIPTDFTSQGPASILFNDNGTRKSNVEIRLTPDIAAIQGTDTTFFGSDVDGNGFPNFTGTSAAAPHAAAVAALVLEANPGFSPDDIYNALVSTASDIGAPGIDAYTGVGLINAWDAIFGAPTKASLPVVENFNNGDLPRYFQTNGTRDSRIEVTSQNGPRGTRHLTMDSGNRATPGLNELILNVNADGYSDVKLTFWQKEFNDNNHVMPATFTGSTNADGVAFSVDGTNWHRLANLTGTQSTNSYKKFGPFNLSNIAQNKGLTLGSNLQIKFQQFGANDISQDGFAFDDISVTGERKVYFSAKIAGGQRELYSSDGTAAGTKVVKNLSGAVSADPKELTMVGDTLFFTAVNSSGQRELYKSDGTAAGTKLVKNLSGTTSSNPLQLTAVGNKLYFTARLANGQRELFVSDGTAAGTKLVENLSGSTSSTPLELTAYKGKLYFTAKLSNGQRELHQSNGTPAGTKLVRNLSGSTNANPKDLTVAGNTLYFSAAIPGGNRELHKSSGTGAGTTLIKDLPGNSNPIELTAVGNTLFFSARLGNGQRELHKSNGTSGGTKLVRNLSGSTSALPQSLTALGNKLFFSAVHSNGNRELFSSTGTSAGTKIVKDLSGSTSSAPQELTAAGNTLFFSATLSNGQRELHKSNGNAGGTKLVKNLSGGISAVPAELTALGDLLFLTAKHTNNNIELFTSDGSPGGTGLVKDLLGGTSSIPRHLTAANSTGSSSANAAASAAPAAADSADTGNTLAPVFQPLAVEAAHQPEATVAPELPASAAESSSDDFGSIEATKTQDWRQVTAKAGHPVVTPDLDDSAAMGDELFADMSELNLHLDQLQ